MSDPGYRVISARYANPEHTAVIAQTHEAGPVAASHRDRPALWKRIHASVAVEPYDPAATPPPPPPAELLPEPIPAPALSDAERRAAAKRRLGAVVAMTSSGPDDQMRYDLALQAINRNVTAMEMFTAEAAVLGITVAELAERVVGERRARERRMMQAHAILARVSAEIDRATGDAIDVAAEAGIREIEGIQ
jgi:hypothetical protein